MASDTLTTQTVIRVQGWDREAVSRIDEPGVELTLIERDACDWNPAALAWATLGTYRQPITPTSAAEQIRAGLAQLGLTDAVLHADMSAIAQGWFGQFNLEQARLRIDVTDQQGCPKFHCDNMHIRLITTYAGPATEYRLADESDAHADHFPPGSIGLLKGCKHPTHGERHLLHRSPPVQPGGRRLCFVLDW